MLLRSLGRWYTLIALLTAGMAIGCSCGTQPPPGPNGSGRSFGVFGGPETKQTEVLEELPPETAQKLRAGLTEFGFKVFGHLAATQPRTNVAFSPYSTWTAFAPVAAAAEGVTAEELVNALRYCSPSSDLWKAVAQFDRELTKQVPVDGHLKASRALWLRPTAQPDTAFWASAQKAGTFTGKLDFAGKPAEAASAVNAWAAEATNNQVRVPLLSASAAAELHICIASALSLKGGWESPFRPSRTRAEPWRGPGRRRNARMMVQTLTTPAAEVGGLKILELRLAGKDIVLDVLLPSESESADTLASRLTEGMFHSFLAALKLQSVEVGLPSFQSQQTTDLGTALIATGARAAFTPAAELPRLGFSQGAWLTQVAQATNVRVDEQGVVAAAVTAIGGSARTVEEAPFPFFADRPFVYVLRTREPALLLFVGLVREPDILE